MSAFDATFRGGGAVGELTLPVGDLLRDRDEIKWSCNVPSRLIGGFELVVGRLREFGVRVNTHMLNVEILDCSCFVESWLEDPSNDG